ncbi:LppX_LprAFG lipoprotein [Nocardioides sp.]|uniref:LppX_LprAFG lipoprotein n=1 Tax=Nocardioides sp. TaxID=35761 RepID=UPI001A1D82C4|nr:LppX_LprAFG lipoprotein [Nocardioides sp.]MBJ7359598.1 LppX_LprAFG lipoprotein [Nocardioides sp.]
MPALALVAALVLLGAGCSDDAKAGGGDDDAPTPDEVLALAKTTLDETSAVTISLETDEVPSGVTGIKSATGVGAHPAAFEGEFELSVNGLPATAEVIAVDGVTYAKNSLLLPDWTSIDPSDYGAPDPAQLMAPDDGFSGLIAAIVDAEEGDSVRGGDDNREIFTEYTGTIPSSAVEALIPTAEGDFDAVLTVSDEGELRWAELTGVFYENADALTYTLELDDYGTEAEITAP